MENNYGEGGNPPPPAAPKRRAGAPRGNRNALKAGRHTAEAQARRRQRAALAREVRLVLHYLACTEA